MPSANVIVQMAIIFETPFSLVANVSVGDNNEGVERVGTRTLSVTKVEGDSANDSAVVDDVVVFIVDDDDNDWDEEGIVCSQSFWCKIFV